MKPFEILLLLLDGREQVEGVDRMGRRYRILNVKKLEQEFVMCRQEREKGWIEVTNYWQDGTETYFEYEGGNEDE